MVVEVVSDFAAEVCSNATRMLARLTMSRSTRQLTNCRCNGSEALEVSVGSRIVDAIAVGGMGERERS